MSEQRDTSIRVPDVGELGRVLARVTEERHVPGAAVGLLVNGQELALGQGITSVDNPLPVDAATLFQIGSITKTFTGTAGRAHQRGPGGRRCARGDGLGLAGVSRGGAAAADLAAAAARGARPVHWALLLGGLGRRAAARGRRAGSAGDLERRVPEAGLATAASSAGRTSWLLWPRPCSRARPALSNTAGRVSARTRWDDRVVPLERPHLQTSRRPARPSPPR